MTTNKNLANEVGIGLFGLGTVGSGVVKILKSEAAVIEKRTGVRIVLKKICVRHLSKKRLVTVPKKLLTTKAADILDDPGIDIVVELMGGLHPAGEIIRRAFRNGKHVVTANKALLAEEGGAIFDSAARQGRRLGFEASVCGGIPIIRAITDGLVSNGITSVLGIVNGTCNHILTAMSQQNIDFSSALHDAQARGYAERDPSLDIDGVDSAHKLAVLARLAFRSEIPFSTIAIEGIRGLSKADIEYARELGYVVKLLAIGKREHKGLELRVHPTLLPLHHPLSNVRGVYNAVFIHANQAGDQLFYGRGAGMMPTASAVLSDIVQIGREVRDDVGREPIHLKPLPPSDVLPMGSIVSKYYLRFQVVDKPGVLGRIADALGKNNISILSVHQKESHHSKSVPVIILTYEAVERNVRAALKKIDAMHGVSERTTVIRVEN